MKKNIFFFGLFFALVVGVKQLWAFSLSDLNLGLDQVKINYTKKTTKKITLADIRNGKDLQVRLSANLTAINDSGYFKVFLHSSSVILAPEESDFILDGGQIDRISKLSKTSYVLQITPMEGAKQVLIQVEAEQIKDIDGNSNELASNEVIVHVTKGNEVGGEKSGSFEELSEDGVLKNILNSILGSQPTTNKNIQNPAQLPVSVPSPVPVKKIEEDKFLANSWMLGLWQSMSGLFGRGGAGTAAGGGNAGSQVNGNGNFSGNPGNGGGGPAADTGNRDRGRAPDRGGDPVKPDNTQPAAEPTTPPAPKFTDEVRKQMEDEVQKIYNIVDKVNNKSVAPEKDYKGQDTYYIEGRNYTQQEIEDMKREVVKIQDAIKKQEVYIPKSTPDPTSDMYTTETAGEIAKLRKRHDELELSLRQYEQQEDGSWLGNFPNDRGHLSPHILKNYEYIDFQKELSDLKKKLGLPADTAPTKEEDVDLLKGGAEIEVEKVGIVCELVSGKEENCREPGTPGQWAIYRVTVKKGNKQTTFLVNENIQHDAKKTPPINGGGFVNEKGSGVLAMLKKDHVLVIQGKGKLEKGKLVADDKDKIRINKDDPVVASKPIDFTPPAK